MKELLPNIKNLLSGSKAIKYTPKGVRYTFFQDKSFVYKGFGNTGKISFFSDFGEKACYADVKYSNFDKKLSTSSSAKYWFKIKNARMYISSNCGFRNADPGTYKIISNSPIKISFNAIGGKRNLKPHEKLKSFLIKWAAKNGVILPNKYKKEDFKTVCLLLCYPELTYFFDFCTDRPAAISSIVTSELNGIKGLNHGLDRLCGFHGKKLKKILNSGNVNQHTRLYEKLAFCRMLKNLVTDDDILTLFNGEGLYWVQRVEIKDYRYIRYLIKNFSRDTIMNWLSDAQNYQLLIDAAKQLYINHQQSENKITIPETNNLEDVHNIITGNVRRMTVSEGHKKADYTEINKEYKDYEFNLEEMEVRLPANSQELIDCSQVLANCLSGYTSWHGSSGIILFVKMGELKYAIAISRGKDLEQFYGKHNHLPDKQDYDKIINYLMDKKLIVSNMMNERMNNHYQAAAENQNRL